VRLALSLLHRGQGHKGRAAAAKAAQVQRAQCASALSPSPATARFSHSENSEQPYVCTAVLERPVRSLRSAAAPLNLSGIFA
jgi:hypothetical protein